MRQRYYVRKEFTFDSAHRLVDGYEGKCAHVHGHTWRVRFEISALSLNGFGFVRDFGDFKVMKDFIDRELDHAIILNRNDARLADFVLTASQRHFAMDGNPTSENIARLLFEKARDLGLPVSAVEVDETCSSFARYEA